MKILAAATLVTLINWPAASLAANGSIVYTYDALGRITTASYDTGILIIYTYDANGNRTAQTVNVNSAAAVWGTSNWGSALWHP